MRPRLLLLLLPLAGACTEAAQFVPKVSYDRLDVNELSWQDISTDVVFAVRNPNPIKVGVAEFAYRFDLEGNNLLQGDNADGFRLEPDGVTELAIPVDLVFSDIWNTVEATKGEDVVDFRVAGRFGFDTPIGPVQIPYEEFGDFPALRTPKLSIQRVQVAEIALSGATLELELGVDNEHGSSLFFDDLAYGIEIAGFDVASGLVQTFEAEAAGQSVLSIPLTISFAQVGNAVAQAIATGGPVPVGFAGDVDVDTPFGILPLQIDVSESVSIGQQ